MAPTDKAGDILGLDYSLSNVFPNNIRGPFLNDRHPLHPIVKGYPRFIHFGGQIPFSELFRKKLQHQFFDCHFKSHFLFPVHESPPYLYSALAQKASHPDRHLELSHAAKLLLAYPPAVLPSTNTAARINPMKAPMKRPIAKLIIASSSRLRCPN
jgi:hypothetical protein